MCAAVVGPLLSPSQRTRNSDIINALATIRRGPSQLMGIESHAEREKHYSELCVVELAANVSFALFSADVGLTHPMYHILHTYTLEIKRIMMHITNAMQRYRTHTQQLTCYGCL